MRAVEAYPAAAAEKIEEEGRRNYGSYFWSGFAEGKTDGHWPHLCLWDWAGVRTLYLEQGWDRRINSRQRLERRAYRQDSRNYSGGFSGRRRSEKDLLDEYQTID